MNADDFFAAAPVPVAPAATVSPFTPVPRPLPATKPPSPFPVWKVVAGAVATVALLVTLAVVLWPHSSGPKGADPGMARLFGQQTRAQLPQPVEAEDCTAAVRAFPAIARDAAARAAFIDGCLHP